MSAGAITTGDRASAVNTASLAARLQNMRARSLSLSAPLSAEDQTVQAMDDASPTKWHLAHTTWFFETFVLKPFLPGYQVFDETFHYCFNSYYEAEGPRHPRPFRDRRQVGEKGNRQVEAARPRHVQASAVRGPDHDAPSSQRTAQ